MIPGMTLVAETGRRPIMCAVDFERGLAGGKKGCGNEGFLWRIVNCGVCREGLIEVQTLIVVLIDSVI